MDAGHVSTRNPTRPRNRLSRTVSRPRWREYRALLESAAENGYSILSLESWLLDPGRWEGRRIFLLRHDVDQHPRSAIPIADIERDLGHTSTWYFRWRTASGTLIAELRRRGAAVGLHYETLTRQALLREQVPERERPRMIAAARHVLRGEIAAFAARYGPVRSVCPHGDSRIPDVRNADLLLKEDWGSYGVELDAHLAMRRHELGAWLTDRSAAEGGWREGFDPDRLLADGVTPILCLVHPNNWASGPGLWLDRVLAAALPAPRHDPAHPVTLLRTGSDAPPL
jgi:hypothetical protein